MSRLPLLLLYISFRPCILKKHRSQRPFKHNMPSILSSYRETEPTNSTSTTSTSRYSPADFPRLTNRTSSSPPFTPDFALEPHAAECINNGRTANTADKRAISSQRSTRNRDITKSSWSAVKEEKGGKSQAFQHPHSPFALLLPKNLILTARHEVRHSTVLL